MFVGLFIVVTGLETTVLTPESIATVSRLDLETAPVLSAVTAALSNLVSNVPAVLVLKPFIANSANPQRAWLIVAMASTLAGNFTLIGSVANSARRRRRRHHRILDLFQGRRAADSADDPLRRMVALNIFCQGEP
jgi:Na+/H+ antiporter NhaD/arsenite permease-like protein